MIAAVREQDEQLARRLLAGEPEAFTHFIEYFRPKIFHYSWLMCGNREDAEEVAQDTLLKVFESLNQLHEPERVRPWVFRIAKNVCLMKRRRSVFAPSHELSLDELMPSKDGGSRGARLQIADWSPLPDDQMLQRELTGVLDQAIRELPEAYRSVILLRDVEALSTAETAEILEVSTDVVKTRLHRARLSLRKRLDEYLQSSRALPVIAHQN
jgi:RNA polymerase sigma-70 factor (ECF subfamily)